MADVDARRVRHEPHTLAHRATISRTNGNPLAHSHRNARAAHDDGDAYTDAAAHSYLHRYTFANKHPNCVTY
jgi:hypothetical protein